MALQRIRDAIKKEQLKLDIADRAAWPDVITPDQRIKIFRKCGSACFMRPSNDLNEIMKDPKKNLMFPICRPPAPRTRTCAVSASGLLAASRRARLTKKHPDVVAETQELIKQFGTTDKARKQKVIKRVRIAPLLDGKFGVTILYEDKVKEVLPTPLSKRVVLKRYAQFLSKPNMKLVS